MVTDVPGERIRKILVDEDCISEPDRSVENPDNFDLLKTQAICAAQIALKGALALQESRKSQSDELITG
jgi:hypothetical protein